MVVVIIEAKELHTLSSLNQGISNQFLSLEVSCVDSMDHLLQELSISSWHTNLQLLDQSFNVIVNLQLLDFAEAPESELTQGAHFGVNWVIRC